MGVFGRMFWTIEDLITPSDGAHRVVLGTGVRVLEHDRRRIHHGYTQIRTQLHLHWFLSAYKLIISEYDRKLTL